MAHCPDCGTSLQQSDDVEFVEMDAQMGFIKASKRFYLVACSECGAAVGGGVAAAK